MGEQQLADALATVVGMDDQPPNLGLPRCQQERPDVNVDPTDDQVGEDCDQNSMIRAGCKLRQTGIRF
jgi:hypothetical protein